METRQLDLFHFSTRDAPAGEKLDAWASLSQVVDFSREDDGSAPFEARYDGASVGPMFVGGRTWYDPTGRSRYRAKRDTKRLRDGADFYYFTYQATSTVAWRTDAGEGRKQPFELYMTDAAQSIECLGRMGHAVSLIVPRETLPATTEALHGQTLANAAGILLRDYLQSLFTNLSRMTVDDLPHVVEATTHLLLASVAPSQDHLKQADKQICDLLVERVGRYIDGCVLDADLGIERICRDVGLSRAKLYQLFESTDGVMREIRRRRLTLAHRTLSGPMQGLRKIKDIALSHGFRDEKYFYKVFKAEFGYTPAEARERRQTVEQEGEDGVKTGRDEPGA
ncbi:AraC family transcriptional regulator [Burkholderia alba]|uniref:AraC family transcriptional regulator n=1 Tax=Burkholderia alba TaxID=2683677 RepID=UPI002B0617BA|nr:helix-turn-helix transcriptional regulator [Burkholderia alba]